MSQFIGGVTRYVTALQFSALNLGNTNGTLQMDGTVLQEYFLHRKAHITGFSGSLSGPLTTGTLTFYPTINGSVCPTFSNAPLHLSQQAAYETFGANKDNYLVKAGQSVGVRYTSSDTVTPVTADVSVILEVLLEDVRY